MRLGLSKKLLRFLVIPVRPERRRRVKASPAGGSLIRNLFRLVPVCLVIIFLIGGLVWWRQKQKLPVIGEPNNYPGPKHKVQFFDESTFYPGAKWVEEHNSATEYHVCGGVVPHHLFPGFMIADFFTRLAFQNPKTIILIGPNHYEKGSFEVLTSGYGWETAFGVVEPNELVISELVKSELVRIDEEVLPGDHSVAGMMPFIKYYLPDTQVVPLLVSGKTTQAEVEMLVGELVEHMGEETVLVAAVDFSHYLPNKQAWEKDEVTLGVMKNRDYRQLFAMNNDYLDSPQSIAVLLMVMQELGVLNMEILHHDNSGNMQKNDLISTTSYFVMAYY